MTDGLKLHPRHIPVEEASRELGSWLLDWQKRHGLTDVEYLSLLTGALASRLHSHVRSERDNPRRKRT